ncbi:hypothetical protein GJ744_003502 [Endocarpon pusillum]|uniref:Uncharacterized protein n=1 Tax=Endocarpon pusillum TaxID=364733 RepID=A0A8H7ARC0_9EURO|nr:hypothetical protein GJ744_003502 [Endocarpon pusillum]
MEKAKNHLVDDFDSSTPSASTRVTTPDLDQIPTTEKYAFAFDIDGVLIRRERSSLEPSRP